MEVQAEAQARVQPRTVPLVLKVGVADPVLDPANTAGRSDPNPRLRGLGLRSLSGRESRGASTAIVSRAPDSLALTLKLKP